MSSDKRSNRTEASDEIEIRYKSKKEERPERRALLNKKEEEEEIISIDTFERHD